MENINEDIWINILKFLPMSDQLSLAQVNERVSYYVIYHWTRLKSATLNRDDLELLDRIEKLMQDCLNSWSGSVERLNLPSASRDLLAKWKDYRFPNLRSLDCQMDYNLEEADEETLLLTELFPHLTSLTLNSSTTGRYLWRWAQLKELNLTWCEYLETGHFEEIFGSLKLTKLTLLYYGYNVNLGEGVVAVTRCSTLEELIIDDHHLLDDFMPRLLNLPHFRRLAFYTRDYHEFLLHMVAWHKPLKVRSLLFNDSFWSSERMTESILHMTNLRRLALHEDDIDSHALHAICHKLPKLEELHLLQMRDVPSPTHLWNCIDLCPTLRILNLSSSKMSCQSVDPSNPHISNILVKRSYPLTLHLHNTGLDPEKILPTVDYPNLKITFEPILLDIWSSRFVEIELHSE
ncbi:uncharacterized protein [Drosophila takahashii]|uniref:uncharacterized protein n=1 Tax=Drosophila takahashii TaxID=29030 RepID=UPI001CF88EA7|nr:uncharacterized protein LOC108057549 [Drosophila takahashii]